MIKVIWSRLKSLEFKLSNICFFLIYLEHETPKFSRIHQSNSRCHLDYIHFYSCVNFPEF